MTTFAPLLVSLLGCAPPPGGDAPSDTAGAAAETIGTLRSGEVGRGYVDVEDLRVTSGVTADRQSFVVQDRETGEGALVRLGVVGVEVPPVGTPVRLRGYFDGVARAPVLWLAAATALVVEGEVEPVSVDVAPADPLPFALVRYDTVTVTSQPDPTGRADLSIGRAIDGRFGVDLPELGNTGALTGIVGVDGEVAPRDDADWVGPREPGPVLDVTVAEVLAGEVPIGAMVRVGATQATPWSRDDRLVLLQDADGRGLWVDVEAFGHVRSGVGDLVRLRAEVRGEGELRWLRSWWTGSVEGVGEVVVVDTLDHGAVVEVEATGLAPPGWVGERLTDQGWLLDDRFVDLSKAPDPVRVRAAVDARGEAARLAVIEVLPPP